MKLLSRCAIVATAIVAALVVCPATASASWTKIVSNSGQGSSSAVSTSGGVTTTGADFIVLVVTCFNDSLAQTPTDNAGNTWVKDADFLVSGDIEVKIYHAQSPVTVGVGHVFSFGDGVHDTFPSIGIIAFSGSASTPFDQQNGSASTTGVTSVQTGSITPTQSNELIVAAMAGRQAITGNSLSIDSGMTLEINLNNNGTSSEGIFVGYLFQGAAAAINPTFSWTTATGYAIGIASYKSPSVGGSTPLRMLLGVGGQRTGVH